MDALTLPFISTVISRFLVFTLRSIHLMLRMLASFRTHEPILT